MLNYYTGSEFPSAKSVYWIPLGLLIRFSFLFLFSALSKEWQKRVLYLVRKSRVREGLDSKLKGIEERRKEKDREFKQSPSPRVVLCTYKGRSICWVRIEPFELPTHTGETGLGTVKLFRLRGAAIGESRPDGVCGEPIRRVW